MIDESDFCICQDRLTIEGGGYISCENCSETLASVTYLQLSRNCSTQPCPLAATEVMAFSEIRDIFSGFTINYNTYRDPSCKIYDLYSGPVYTGNRNGQCKGVKINAYSINLELIQPTPPNPRMSKAVYSKGAPNEKILIVSNVSSPSFEIQIGQSNKLISANISKTVQLVDKIINQNDYDTLVIQGSEQQYINSVHQLVNLCYRISYDSNEVSDIFFYETDNQGISVSNYYTIPSLAQLDKFKSCPCTAVFYASLNGVLILNEPSFPSCYYNLTNNTFKIDNMDYGCQVRQQFISGLNCSGVVYQHKILQIDVNCARIVVTQAFNIANMTFRQNDSVVMFSSLDSDNIFSYSIAPTTLCNVQWKLYYRVCETCKDQLWTNFKGSAISFFSSPTEGYLIMFYQDPALYYQTYAILTLESSIKNKETNQTYDAHNTTAFSVTYLCTSGVQQQGTINTTVGFDDFTQVIASCYSEMFMCQGVNSPSLLQLVNNVWQPYNTSLLWSYNPMSIMANFTSSKNVSYFAAIYEHQEMFQLQCNNGINNLNISVTYYGRCRSNYLVAPFTQKVTIYHVLGSNLISNSTTLFSSPDSFRTTADLTTLVFKFPNSVQYCRPTNYTLYQIDNDGAQIPVQDQFMYYANNGYEFVLSVNSTYITDDTRVGETISYRIIAKDIVNHTASQDFDIVLKSICYTNVATMIFNNTDTINTISYNSSLFTFQTNQDVYKGLQQTLPLFYLNYTWSFPATLCPMKLVYQYETSSVIKTSSGIDQIMQVTDDSWTYSSFQVFTPRYFADDWLKIYTEVFLEPVGQLQILQFSFTLNLNMQDLCLLNQIQLNETSFIGSDQYLWINKSSTIIPISINQTIDNCTVVYSIEVNQTGCNLTTCPAAAEIFSFNQTSGTIVLKANDYSRDFPEQRQNVSVVATSSLSNSKTAQWFILIRFDYCRNVTINGSISGFPGSTTKFDMYNLQEFSFSGIYSSDCPITYTLKHQQNFDTLSTNWVVYTNPNTYIDNLSPTSTLYFIVQQVIDMSNPIAYDGHITVQATQWNYNSSIIQFQTNIVNIPIQVLNPCLSSNSQTTKKLSISMEINQIVYTIKSKAFYMNVTVVTNQVSLNYGGQWGNPMQLCINRGLQLYDEYYQLLTDGNGLSLVPVSSSLYQIVIKTNDPSLYSLSFTDFYIGDTLGSGNQSMTQYLNFKVRFDSCIVRQFVKPIDRTIKYNIGDQELVSSFSYFKQSPSCNYQINCEPSLTQTNSTSWLTLINDESQGSISVVISSNNKNDEGTYQLKISCEVDKRYQNPTFLDYILIQIVIQKLVNTPPYFAQEILPLNLKLYQDWTYKLPPIIDDQDDQYITIFRFPEALPITKIDNPLTLQLSSNFIGLDNVGEYYLQIKITDFRGASSFYNLTLQIQFQNLSKTDIKNQDINNKAKKLFPAAQIQNYQEVLDKNGKPEAQMEIANITHTGLLTIKFMSSLMIPITYNSTQSKNRLLTEDQVRLNSVGLDQLAVDVIVFSGVQGLPLQNFIWNMTKMYKNIVEIQLYFEKPLSISKNLLKPENIQIKFLKPYYFVSNINGQIMAFDQQVIGLSIPTQFNTLQDAIASQTIADLVENASLGVLIGTCVGQFFAKSLIKKIWPLFLLLQIIIIFDLQNQNSIPQNVILVLSQLNGIMQLDALPKDKIFAFFTPLKVQFEQSDSLISNLSGLAIITTMIFFTTGLIYLIQRLSIRYTKVQMLLTKICNFIFWNFLLKMIQGSCLSFMFAAARGISNYINIKEFQTFGNIFTSCIILVIILVGIIFCFIFMYKKAKTPQLLLKKSTKDKYGVLYQDADEYRWMALQTFTVFLVVRLSVALIISGLFTFEIQSQLFIQVAMIEFIYIISVKPLSNKTSSSILPQQLSVFNIVILFIIAHFNLIFSEFGPEDLQKFQFGWLYLSVIIIAIGVNFSQMVIFGIFPIIKRKFVQRQRRFEQAKNKKKRIEARLRLIRKIEEEKEQKRLKVMEQNRRQQQRKLDLKKQKKIELQKKREEFWKQLKLEKIPELSDEGSNKSDRDALFNCKIKQLKISKSDGGFFGSVTQVGLLNDEDYEKDFKFVVAQLEQERLNKTTLQIAAKTKQNNLRAQAATTSGTKINQTAVEDAKNPTTLTQKKTENRIFLEKFLEIYKFDQQQLNSRKFQESSVSTNKN